MKIVILVDDAYKNFICSISLKNRMKTQKFSTQNNKESYFKLSF